MHLARPTHRLLWSLPVTLRESAEKEVERTAGSAVVLVPMVVSPETERKRKAGLSALLLIGPFGANGFDAYSTREAMKAGGKEGNPAVAKVADNEAALYLTKMGVAAGTDIAAQALAKTGHRNLGKLVAGLGIVLPLAAGIHNMGMAKKK